MREEVDMQVFPSDDMSMLGVFLYAENGDRRSDLRALLRAEGAGYVDYPIGDRPARIAGRVLVSDTSVTVLIGKLFIVCPMAVSMSGLRATQAALYFTEQPFDIEDKGETSLLAATLSLDVLAAAEAR